jgi:ferredoxin-NADP reductase
MALPSVLLVRKARVSQIKFVTPELFTMSCVLPTEELFSFQAGQWVYLHLLNEQGESIAKGAFSIASAPSEGLADLSFAVKIYGRLTETFAAFKPGDQIGVQGPFGVFTLPKEESTPTLFLAGGIGITPFRSMIREVLAQSSTAPTALIWVDRTWDNLLYHHEFEAWAKESNGRFLYHPTLTRDSQPDWTGWRGRLDATMLDSLPLDWATAQAYVCGPMPFMTQAKALLAERGLVGRARVHEERFS